MSFWQRVVRLLKANINDMIAKAEDPRKIMEQVLLEMQQQYKEAKKQVTSAVADEKLFQKKEEKAKKQASEWEEKAIQAVSLGDDNLARAALTKKNHFEKLAGEYEKQWQEQHRSVSQLKKALQLLQTKLEEAERQKEILLARQKRASAQRSIQATVSNVLESSAYQTLQKMAEKIEIEEAQAEAEFEISRELQEQDLEEQFRELERFDEEQENALQELKQKLGVLEEQKEPVYEELDEEMLDDLLEEMKAKLTTEQ